MRAAWLVLVALALSARFSAGPAVSAEPSRPPGHRPPPIPLAEIARRADEVGDVLHALAKGLPPSARIEAIENGLDRQSQPLATRLRRLHQTIETQPSLASLDSLAGSWQSARVRFRGWLDTVIARLAWLEQQRVLLDGLTTTWAGTDADLRAASAPASLVRQIEAIRESVASARRRVESATAETLILQERVARELNRCEDALTTIEQARRRATVDLFVRESPPVWRMSLTPLAELPAAMGAAWDDHVAALREFAEDQPGPLLAYAGAIAALIGAFWWSHRRLRSTATERDARGPVLLGRPVSAGLVLGLLSWVVIYPGKPPAAQALVAAVALVPMMWVVRSLVNGRERWMLYGLAGLFLVDRLRDLVTSLGVIERGLFVLEMLATRAILGWYLRSGRARDHASASGGPLAGLVSPMLKLALAALAAALVAGVVGNMSLARLVGSGVLASAYLVLVLAAARRLAEGLVVLGLETWPVRRLAIVRLHRARLEQRARTVLRTIAVAVWVLMTLGDFGLLSPALTTARHILAAELMRGALRISVSDLVVFALTVWAAFAVSALVRFVLEEDVFPRLPLSPGLPYALSSVVGYAIIFAGFIVAALAAGVNLDRVTLLGGAFGVGVGFGLQNVVNNFVSGLVVLFERPVRVGDAVQIGDTQGEVRRIGIRAATVRSWQGAEIIVPNSMLVAEKVTNWTPANRQRRVEIPVSVVYGSAPEAVLKVLADVAQAHPDVAAQPPPQPLFMGFGDSALRFELWAWTYRLDRHVVIKSELGVAVYAALQAAGMKVAVPRYEVTIRR
jgi:potassium-dependent mechanosensitive channel